MSNFCTIKYSVPQGSVLGPILFLLYVNDLHSVSKFETTLFANDTNLYLSHYNIKTLQENIAEEIHKIDESKQTDD